MSSYQLRTHDSLLHLHLVQFRLPLTTSSTVQHQSYPVSFGRTPLLLPPTLDSSIDLLLVMTPLFRNLVSENVRSHGPGKHLVVTPGTPIVSRSLPPSVHLGPPAIFLNSKIRFTDVSSFHCTWTKTTFPNRTYDTTTSSTLPFSAPIYGGKTGKRLRRGRSGGDIYNLKSSVGTREKGSERRTTHRRKWGYRPPLRERIRDRDIWVENEK